MYTPRYQEVEQETVHPRPKKCTFCGAKVHVGARCSECETTDVKDLAAEEELPF